jgi:hypothetical protein
MIFSFASENTIVVVLLQRNEQGYEQPISFFRKTLRDSELKYDIMEKQAYALVKALKSFRVYVLQSEITAYVPSSAVKEILVQPDCEGKRGKWITKILEYDLTIKPTQLIKGQGLAKLMTESNCKAIGLYHLSDKAHDSSFQIEETNSQVNNKYVSSPWYKDIIFFLLNFQSPPELDKSKFRSLKLRAVKYCIIDQILFWKDPNGFLLRCVDEKEAEQIFHDLHHGVCGGHHHWKATAFKILRAGYYWPVLFSDIFSQVRACEPCQKFAGKQKLMSLPLKPIITHGPFQQWGLDFIGEINPSSSGQHRWILTTTDYFTKWIEAIPTQNAIDKVIMDFLEGYIFSRFGCPKKLVIDNAQAFKSNSMIEFCNKYSIKLVHSTPYYPQGNGLAESSNKTLIRIIKKLLAENKKSWDSKLKFSLWADRISNKKSIGTSPFQMVYGT